MTHDPMCQKANVMEIRFGNVCSQCDLIARVREDERIAGLAGEPFAFAYAEGRRQGQRDERERHANELDVAVAKARAEVVTVNLEGDFNYVRGYNDGLVEGDAKGRREGKRIASMRGESDG